MYVISLLISFSIYSFDYLLEFFFFVSLIHCLIVLTFFLAVYFWLTLQSPLFLDCKSLLSSSFLIVTTISYSQQFSKSVLTGLWRSWQTPVYQILPFSFLLMLFGKWVCLKKYEKARLNADIIFSCGVLSRSLCLIYLLILFNVLSLDVC